MVNIICWGRLTVKIKGNKPASYSIASIIRTLIIRTINYPNHRRKKRMLLYKHKLLSLSQLRALQEFITERRF
jgi:hypothetical protein